MCIKTITCGLSHSGCVLDDGSVYLWGISGDIQYSKEFMDKSLLKKPTKILFRSQVDAQNPGGNMSHRRRSTAPISEEFQSNIVIEDLKLGEQFSIALSNKGIVYAWGQNDKGQLGLGNEVPTFEPAPVITLNRTISKIDCGLKHCIALSKDYQLFGWGSNL